MNNPLDGITVLEQGTFITGPAAGMLLADLGAKVIKVEQPVTGDPFRAFRGGLCSPHFQAFNRNKLSITLDTKVVADAAVFDELIKSADVYIHNFRPGVAERLGVGWARMRRINPRLVYAAISGFGQSGPDAMRPAYDTVAQAASGFLKLLVNPANPRVVGPAIADVMTGFYTAYGVIGALIERGRTGQGKLVEVSMLEAMCHFNVDSFTQYFAAGEINGPFTRASASQSYVVECEDGKWLALHMSSPEKFWIGLANVIGQPAILEDPRFSTREDRIRNQDALIARLRRAFAKKPRENWCKELVAADVPHAPMYDVSEVVNDDQVQHLKIIVETQTPDTPAWRTVRSPITYNGQPSLDVAPPPTLGEHNDAVVGPIRQQLLAAPPVHPPAEGQGDS